MRPFLTVVELHDELVEEDEATVDDRLARKFSGPQTRTVESSDTEAKSCGCFRFQETQLTERQWPLNTAIGVSHLVLYM